MPLVHFILKDGTTTTIDAHEGETLMGVATSSYVPGIEAACGGFCSCGTCHVYVDPAWLDRLPPRADDEVATLEGVAAERRENSRLGCQITITAAMDGLTVTMPDRQS